MTPYLILYSGGMDSFLTAAMYAESNIPVVLLSLNNGAVAAEEYLAHGVIRLQNRYGKELITFAGVYPTCGLLQKLKTAWLYTPQAELAKKYQHVTNNQLQCLHCQSAMWTAAIAYAVAKNIKHIAAGYHAYDEFCTGSQKWTNLISAMAAKYDIQTLFPVWDENDWKDKTVRGLAMLDRSFEPQVLEPKCMLGMPATKPNESETRDLICYFSDNIMPKMPELIDRLVRHFRVVKLSKKSLEPLDYPLPKPVGGMF